MYLNYIVDALANEICDPVKLGITSVNGWLYTDDIILLTESEPGLQKRLLDKLSEYFKTCCLNVTYEKSCVMLVNKAGRIYDIKSITSILSNLILSGNIHILASYFY